LRSPCRSSGTRRQMVLRSIPKWIIPVLETGADHTHWPRQARCISAPQSA
jgi:hypothetical protein